MKKPKAKPKYVKCGKKTLCKTLVSFLQDRDAKGIVVWDLVNIETLEQTRRLVGYKEDRKAKGLLFNFCPWCGGKLGERK